MRFKKSMMPTGIKGAEGTLSLSEGNPLRGARVRRVRMTPTGNTVVELLQETAAKSAGFRFVVPAGIFQRDVT
jgi:hypothetical protein